MWAEPGLRCPSTCCVLCWHQETLLGKFSNTSTSRDCCQHRVMDFTASPIGLVGNRFAKIIFPLVETVLCPLMRSHRYSGEWDQTGQISTICTSVLVSYRMMQTPLLPITWPKTAPGRNKKRWKQEFLQSNQVYFTLI